jgi:hypothetical protein
MATADDHRTYSIRQLCREFGATARALRFYEDKGLLTPARKGQTRVYDARPGAAETDPAGPAYRLHPDRDPGNAGSV